MANSGCWVASPPATWLESAKRTRPSASTSTDPKGSSPASRAARASSTQRRRWARSASSTMGPSCRGRRSSSPRSTLPAMPPLPMPDDWQRALVVAAHPDDIEYGLAAAVAVWTAAGKEVHYLLATRGEAGMAGVPPAEAAPLPAGDGGRAAAGVGGCQGECLDPPDGAPLG